MTDSTLIGGFSAVVLIFTAVLLRFSYRALKDFRTGRDVLVEDIRRDRASLIGAISDALNTLRIVLKVENERLLSCSKLVEKQCDNLSTAADDLERQRDAMSGHFEQLQKGTRSLLHLVERFSSAQNTTGAGSAGLWTAGERPLEYAEIVPPNETPYLVHLPQFPGEPVHPDIQKALLTPGWILRYPDGRVEPGVQEE